MHPSLTAERPAWFPVLYAMLYEAERLGVVGSSSFHTCDGRVYANIAVTGTQVGELVHLGWTDAGGYIAYLSLHDARGQAGHPGYDVYNGLPSCRHTVRMPVNLLG